jgi:hypothetical protein
MKRLASIVITVMLLVSVCCSPAIADGWGDMLGGLGGLVDSMLGEEDNGIPSFDDAFKGPAVSVELGGKNIKIHENFKIIMDTYEAFFDEYIVFMSNPDMTQYMAFITQYADAMEALDRLDEYEMSNAETAYYTDVLLRITQKLLTVAAQ